MKKLLLLSLSCAVAVGGFAQQHHAGIAKFPAHLANQSALNFKNTNPFAKTTGDGDTLSLPAHFGNTDTISAYYYVNDSGYIYGINGFGNKGYAELYAVDGNDSMVQVLGGFAAFTGTYNPASTKTVTFNVWNIGQQTQLQGNYYLSGLPTTSLASVSVPITQLGIDNSHTQDSGVIFVFPTPTTNVSAFFLGYEINYNWNSLGGDTVGLYSNINGERTTPPAYVNGTDTVIFDQNAIEDANGNWNDGFLTTQILNDYYIYPIVVIHYTGVTNVVNKGLSFFGNYPNPATNNTTVQFGLNKTADVTITVTDMSGRTITTISKPGMSIGNHTVDINTSNMPAGDYIYMIRTSNGAGIASKLTVIK